MIENTILNKKNFAPKKFPKEIFGPIEPKGSIGKQNFCARKTAKQFLGPISQSEIRAQSESYKLSDSGENSGIKVKKKNSIDTFDTDEIIRNCISAGAPLPVASGVAKEIITSIRDGITVQEIRSMIYASLFKINPKIAEQYKYLQKYKSQLMIRTSKTTLDRFDRNKIVGSLIKETTIKQQKAEFIAREVERELGRLRLNYVTAPLIREIVNVKLLEHGLEKERAQYTRLGMPVYDVKNLIDRGSKENANLQYNPESVHKLMADQISKEYALINLLPIELADAHMAGEIHIHDLDYFIRPFCFSHDIRFFLKNGFKADGVGNHTAVAGPAKRPEVAFLHAAKVLAASQTNCAGGQGFSYFNTFLAPYISGMEYKKIKQLAQMFIYELSVDGEEKIPILDNNEFKIIKIGEFVDKIVNNSREVIRRGDSEIVKLVSSYKVLSFDKNGIIRFLPITGVSKHKASELYEVTTKFGKKVKVTKYHSLFTFDGKGIVPIRVEKLKEEDYVVGIKNISVSLDRNTIDLYDELCKLNRDELRITNLGKLIEFLGDNSRELGDSWHVNQLLDGKRTISFGKLRKLVEKYNIPSKIIDELSVTSSTYSKKKYYLPLKLLISDEFLRLIGYYLAEGYTNKGDEGMGIGLGIDHDQTIKDDVRFCVKKVFMAEAYEAEKWNLRFGGKLGVILFRDILRIGESAISKKLPDWILMLPNNKLKEVLMSYVTSDGFVSDARLVGISTSSRDLLDQLRFMFLRFGIITRHNILRLKGEKLKIRGRETKANADSHTLYITDMNSAFKYLEEIGFVNYKSERLLNILNLKGIPQTPEYMLAPVNGRMVNINTLTCNPLKHDISLEKVIKIEKLNTEKYVYDLEVEETQNFCTMSGLGLHNSQMYVARGGQTVFSSIDCDISVPEQFRDIPAVLPGGNVKDSVTYSDFEDETRMLFNAIVDVYLDGDYIGKPFNFPKFEVQVHPDNIKKGEHDDELLKVSELASKFGTPYYIINQPYMPKFACYQSMPWGEKILILRDDKILPIEIGRYVDEIMAKGDIKKENGLEGEIEISKVEDYAISFNPKTLKVEKRKIGKVMRHKNKERVLRFTLDGNRTLAATDKHKVPVVRDNGIKEVRVKEIKVGDFVIGLKNLNLNLEFNSRLKFKGKDVVLGKDIARLLGYFASEGYIHVANRKNRMNKVCFSFNQSEMEYIKDVSNILRNKFGCVPKFDNSKKNKTTTVYVYDKSLVELFVNELKTGSDAKTKRVPERLISAPIEILREFILGMFRGDAHLGNSIDLYLCNKDLIDDIFLITLRIGIPFELVPRENSHHLRLTSSLRINQFIDEIPFVSINCEIPLKTFDFYDRIPVEPFNITRVEMKTGHWNRSQVGKRVTENRLELGENLFTNFISSDLHLFEVKQIEEVNSEYVYDLVDVDQYHNFANVYGIFSSNCCSFLMPLDTAATESNLFNGTLRGGGLQVITINLPQLAYIANGNDAKLFELLRERMGKAKEILLLKREIINKNLKNNLLPFMSQIINENGERYLEPDGQSYIIGIVGMNELVRAYTGEELHESDNAWTFALKVMKTMKEIVAEFRKETGLNFSLARTPAESSAYRLAQIDMEKYPDNAIFNGSGKSAYYTNSFHVRPSADIPLWKRLTIEGAFHALTDGGAMSHVWIGESNPSPEGIYELTKKIATKTAIQYFAYTKDLSVCSKCNTVSGGLIEKCPNCGSGNIDWWSRITGYYQNVSGWNKGKLAELKDRRRYGVSGNSTELPIGTRKKLDETGKNGWDSEFDF